MGLAWLLPAIWGIVWIAEGLMPSAQLGNVLWLWFLPTLVSTLVGGMIIFVGLIALLFSLFSKGDQDVRHTRRTLR